MKDMLTAIQGKKTYIVAGATILYCVFGVGLHFMTLPMALSIIGTAGSIAALRNGVGKVQGILEIILEILKLIGQTTSAPTVAIDVPKPTVTETVTGEAPVVASTTTEATPTVVTPAPPAQ